MAYGLDSLSCGHLRRTAVADRSRDAAREPCPADRRRWQFGLDSAEHRQAGTISTVLRKLGGGALSLVAGGALKPEATKTAEIDRRASERATWSAQARVELFRCFFIKLPFELH